MEESEESATVVGSRLQLMTVVGRNGTLEAWPDEGTEEQTTHSDIHRLELVYLIVYDDMQK